METKNSEFFLNKQITTFYGKSYTLNMIREYFTSEGPKRHTLKFPSARSRNLLQPPQKCSVIDVMKDTVPECPSILKFLAVSVG